MTKFTWDDVVTGCNKNNPALRMGERAWIVGICEDHRRGTYHAIFPQGTVYTIEFEDGSSIDVHEDDLLPFVEKV